MSGVVTASAHQTKSSAPPTPQIRHRAGDNASAIVVDSESSGPTPMEAIYVRNAVKSYGVGKRRSTVLRGLDMTVKKGTM